jgi:outer membrane lipase/esterase
MRRASTFATGWSRHDVSQQTCAVRTCWVVKSALLAFLAVNAFDTACAAPVASDWVSAWFGAAYKLNAQAILRGAISTVFANPQVISYGGELGVNVSF